MELNETFHLYNIYNKAFVVVIFNKINYQFIHISNRSILILYLNIQALVCLHYISIIYKDICEHILIQ